MIFNHKNEPIKKKSKIGNLIDYELDQITKRLAESMYQSTPQPIVLTDKRGDITDYGKSQNQLLGISEWLK